jgi:hypothetical protein
MKLEYTTFLTELSALNESLSYDVFLDTRNESVKIKQLNTEQFNDILSTLVNDSFSENGFIPTIANILNSNILDKNVDIYNLSYLDFVKIILETRKNCITDSINLIFSDDEKETYNLQTDYFEYSLKEHLRETASTDLKFEPITYNNITVTLTIPSVKTVITLDSTIKIQNTEITSDIVKKFFIKEITKYISSVSINENNILFSDLLPLEQINIVNNLPAHLINEIIKSIEVAKNSISSLILAKIPYLDVEGKEASFFKEISIDGTLFNY